MSCNVPLILLYLKSVKLVQPCMQHVPWEDWKIFASVSDIIKRNNMLTFANRPDPKTKGTKDIGVQRQNMMFITQRFFLLQSRPDAGMTYFFRFENQREPTSLANKGVLLSRMRHSSVPQCNHWPRSCCQKSHRRVVGIGSWLLSTWSDPQQQRHSASMCHPTLYHIWRPK